MTFFLIAAFLYGFNACGFYVVYQNRYTLAGRRVEVGILPAIVATFLLVAGFMLG